MRIHLYLFCLVTCVFTQNLKAQNCWSPLGSGLGLNSYGPVINSLVSYNGTLVAAGTFDSVSGIMANNIASWNGTTWSILGSGMSIDTSHSTTVYVKPMAVYNGELYVAGQFDSAGGVPVNNIAKWNGTSWSAVGLGLPGTFYTVNALAVYNGALYAGGIFDTAGGFPAHHIAKWNGTQWSAVDSGVSDGIGNYNFTSIFCLTATTKALYVGGTFTTAGNIPARNIAVWNDTTWSALGTGLGVIGAQVNSFAFYQGNLYAAYFGSVSHSNPDSLAIWDGTTWANVGWVKSADFDIGIHDIFTFDSLLIVSGRFDSAGGVPANNLAQWNGTNWAEFGGGTNYAVNVVETYDSYLHIGGFFTQAGNSSADCIAKYTCASDGIRDIPANHAHIYPNPTTGLMNITIDNAQDGMSIQIYDLLAERIFQSSINASASTIDLSGHAPGTYIYHISGSNGENISAGTFVIQ